MLELSQAAPITPGTLVEGTLDPANQTHLYRFTAAAGDKFYFDTITPRTGAPGATWRLIDPFGVQVPGWSGSTSLSSDVDTLTLRSAGTYYLMIEGSIIDTVAGTYRFNVLPVNPVVTSLTLGDTVSAGIDVPGEQDLYTFTLTQRSLLLFDSLANSNLVWSLSGPGGLKVNTRVFNTADSGSLPLDLVAGNYTLTVDANLGATGAYSFRLNDLSQGTPLTLGTPVDGALSPGNETDIYKFSATAGDRFYFDGISRTGIASATWRLIDPYGAQVPGWGGSQSGPAQNLSNDTELALPATGTYYLVFEGSISDAAPGTYRFNAQPVTFAGAPLVLGQTTAGEITVAGEQDLYTFSLTHRTRVYFDSLVNTGSTNWSLSGPAGMKINARNFNSSDSSPPIDLVAGNYTLTVDASAANTGQYRFRLWDLSEIPTITPGVAFDGEIDPANETNLYRFTANAGDRFYFDSISRTGAPSAQYRLIDQYGVNVFGSISLTSDTDTIALPSTGAYTLLIEGNITDSVPGTFRFNVQNVQFAESPLTLGAITSGDIAVVGEQDVHTFTLAQRRMALFVPMSGGGNIRWTLTGPAGVMVNNFGFNSSIFTIDLPAGDYRLSVDGNLANTGTYSFQLHTFEDQPFAPSSQETTGTLPLTTAAGVHRIEGQVGHELLIMPGTSTFFGTASQLASTTGQLFLDGGVEDGYDGMYLALNGYAFRPGAAVNVVLVSDEDRDIISPQITLDAILAQFLSRNALLNAVVSASLGSSSPGAVLGVDSKGNAYRHDGNGGFIIETGGRVIAASENTKFDYVDPAWVTGGAAWNLDFLRAGGLSATAFTKAFVHAKTREIEQQLGVNLAVSDPSVVFKNLTGALDGLSPGDTAEFDIELTGDGTARTFDLQFVRNGTGILLGSIPVRIIGDYTYQVRAADPDGDTLRFSLQTAPAGATIDPDTGLIRWRAAVAGTYDFVIMVDDGKGGTATQTYSLTVTEGTANALPVVTSTPVASATVGRPYSYQVTATDADGDALTFLLTSPPAGVTINSATGLLSWTPAETQIGEHDINVIVSDGRGGRTTHTIQLTVGRDQTNRAPVFQTQPITTAQPGQVYRYQAKATDPDADPITYDLSLAPAGMTIDATSGIITWSPGAAESGDHTVIVRASDGRQGFAVQSFVLNVAAVNTALVITSTPDLSAVATAAYAYQLRAQDAEGDTLAYRLKTAPQGMTINATTGLISWTPGESQTGPFSVEVEVTDHNSALVVQAYTLTVTAATTENASPKIESTPRLSIAVGDQYVYAVQGADPDGDPLTYSLDTAPGGMSIDPVTGVVTWTPAGNQLGNSTVKVRVEDGRGGFATQEFVVAVIGTVTQNTAPTITSTPTGSAGSAVVGQEYRYDANASDADGDPLTWSLTQSPAGMTIDPATGQLRWTPRADQTGPQQVTLAATDARGTSVTQTFTLTVTAVNLPPQIVSTPATQATVDQPYAYEVVAADPEDDALTYTLASGPLGMTFDPATRRITWRPGESATGSHPVVIKVQDIAGNVTEQRFSIAVTQTVVNRSPSITSTPTFQALSDQLYTYQVTAVDPDGHTLTYALTEKPAGMTIDPATGRIEWTPAAAQANQSFFVTVTASDGQSAASQRFQVAVRQATVNAAPLIRSTSPTTVLSANEYRYDVQATDANNDRLTYSLSGAPAGMTISSLGQIRWSPKAANVGPHTFTITVTDPHAATATQTVNLTVQPDTQAPVVRVQADFIRAGLGDQVTFLVTATDNVAVSSLTLKVNGQAVTLDAGGFAVVTMTQTGAAIPVVATITEDNLQSYKLEFAPLDSTQFKTIAQGTDAPANGIFGQFDPTVLANGPYTLRLTATDDAGNTSTLTRIVNVAGELKLGDFHLSFTDLSVPISGIPILVTRSYNTLDANTDGELGFGWRLEFGNMNLRVTLPDPQVALRELGQFPAYQDGTRVLLTLPGGRTVGFTFRPRLESLLGGSVKYYHPDFVPDAGVTARLSAPDLRLVPFNGQGYVSAQTYTAYNPASAEFGGHLTLKTADGATYRINAQSGRLSTLSAPSGATLTFSDSGVRSSAGPAISFARDFRGRITAVTDTDGDSIRYTYDALGNLASVTNRAGERVTMAYQAPAAANQPHYLTGITDGRGVRVLTVDYDPVSGRLRGLIDGTGGHSAFSYPLNVPELGPNFFVEAIGDATGVPGELVYDARGNLVRRMQRLDGTTDRWAVQVFKYDANDNPTAIYELFEAVGRDRYTATPTALQQSSTYDAAGNVLTETDALGNTTRFEYDQFGNPTRIVDPLGNVSTTLFDASGRPTRTIDALGNVALFKYDQHGNVVGFAQVNAQGQEIQRYHTVADPRGNDVEMNTPDGRTFYMRHDGDGNTTLSYFHWEDPRDGDALVDRTIVTRTFYDEEGRIVGTAQFLLSGRRDFTAASELDGATPEWSTSTIYDNAGQVIRQTDRFGVLTQTRFDAAGRAVEVRVGATDAGGNPVTLITRAAYDPAGRLIAATDPYVDGATEQSSVRVAHTVYDDLGRETSVRRLAGIQIQLIDRGNGVFETAFDSDYSQAAVLSSTHTAYYPDGRIKSRTSADGLTTYLEYDAAGRQTAEIIAIDLDQDGAVETSDANGDGIPDAGTELIVRRSEYNGRGQQIRVIDPLGRQTEFVYDRVGRLTGTIQRGDAATGDAGSESLYDALGRRTAQIDPAGRRTDFGYDDAGRLVSVTLPGVFDANPQSPTFGQMVRPVYRYAFDAAGNQVSTTDPQGRVSAFGFDPHGRQTSRTLPLGIATTADDSDFVETTEYFVGGKFEGLVNTATDFEGRRTTYSYDFAGRLQSKSQTDPGSGQSRTVSYTYDAFGRLVRTDDSTDGTTRYAFDADGRLIQIDRSAATDHSVVNFAYDAATGRMTRTWTSKDASGSDAITDTRYAYDKLGRIIRVSLVERDDVALSGGGEQTRYVYDAAGYTDHQLSSNGVTVETDYDALGRLQSLTHFKDANSDGHRDAGEALVASFEYGYDKAGKRTSAIETIDGQTQTFRWEYDALDRVIGEQYAGPLGNYTTRFTFDLSSNRLSAAKDTGSDGDVDQKTTYTYDANDRLLTEKLDLGSDGTIDHTTTYAYVGTQRTTKTVTDASGATLEAHVYEYDSAGRLARVTNTKGQVSHVSEYAYNAEGIRVRESIDGQVTLYVINPANLTRFAQILEERTATGQILSTFTLGWDVLAQADANGVLHLLYDGHGSTRALLDAGGAVLNGAAGAQVFSYDAYGNQLDTGVTPLTSLLYSGEQTDSATGLQYLRARYYDPGSGTFGSLDSAAGDPRQPLSLHKYLYAHGNPINQVDPSGAAVFAWGALTDLALRAQVAIVRATAAIFQSKEMTIQGYREVVMNFVKLNLVTGVCEEESFETKIGVLRAWAYNYRELQQFTARTIEQKSLKEAAKNLWAIPAKIAPGALRHPFVPYKTNGFPMLSRWLYPAGFLPANFPGLGALPAPFVMGLGDFSRLSTLGFSPVVNIQMTGSYQGDRLASVAAGGIPFAHSWFGSVSLHQWHHHEVLGLMQLVSSAVHNSKLDHEGGIMVWQVLHHPQKYDGLM
jgi:RHS repeat-associated protein